ncbi:MAG: glycoside hydrolase family 31 protein, partial [Acidobacteriaceae bacterium]|nr:glycoside hydrolase family 31 protein [Acidobacteriaceae bacterium]
MEITTDQFRFGFSRGAVTVAAPHPESGILVGGAPLSAVTPGACSETRCNFTATSASGEPVAIAVELLPDDCSLTISLTKPASVLVRTAGIAPAYGFSDMAYAKRHYDTDLTGIAENHLITGSSLGRLASNFAIFPRQGMAEVLLWPKVKIAHFTAQENAQGAALADSPIVTHFFFGAPRTLYAAFARVRRQAGYPLMMPKYEMFGVGWEAFGALGWETNQTTIRDSVDHYLKLGYPIKWLVIGSGFWPNQPSNMQATTSFGLWDSVRYPSPEPFLQHFHDENLRVLLGLRIAFITTGPFAQEGVRNHYFLEEDGKPQVFNIGFPHSPCYLLDAQKPQAVDWYFDLVAKWKNFGVDGFKEDLYGYEKYDLRDDKVNPISDRLMTLGFDLIERNGYLASDGDIQRIDDFNYNQNQDRGPVNALSFAYSGLPLVYPDIVGGTFGEDRFDTNETAIMDKYMMRNVQWAALHSSLSMGQPPWLFKSTEVGKVMLKATQTHERLRPYIYSQAVRFIHDGYPWTMTPLPVAFPEEPGVYGRENDTVRGYEWMIGDALLATPLYGNDYATATTRDIYLPGGSWIDYETGERFEGPTLLKSHPIPVEKTPLFVGGTGIVIEQQESGLVARIYPVAKTTETEFWSSDGRSRSAIVLHVSDWKKLRVTDTTTHQAVPCTETRFAMQFLLIAGHSYRVE